jgi:TolB protein
MRGRLLGSVLLAVILFFAAGIVYMWASPRVVAFSPAQGEYSVPAGAALQLTFSRPMQTDSVAGRLESAPARSGEYTWQDEKNLLFRPDRPWPYGERVKVVLKPGARSAGLLSLPIEGEQSWSFEIGYPRLAYLYPADGPADIYILDLESQETRRLTDSPGQVLDFSITFNGSAIYYNTSQGDGGSTIYRMDIPAESDQPLARATMILRCAQALCRYPNESPNGSYLAYERTSFSDGAQPDEPQVWLLSLKGGQDASSGPARKPFLADQSDHETQYPMWSPSGRLTYYDHTREAFVIRYPESQQFDLFPSQTGIQGDWAPQGDYFVIPEIFVEEAGSSTGVTDLEATASSHLLRYTSQSGMVEDMTRMNDLEDTTPLFSPDGGWLAFTRQFLDIASWTPGRQIWVMRPDGSQARQVTQEPHYNHYDLAWHPDGERLAYVRFNQTLLTEPPEIWMIDLQTGVPTRLVQGGYAPQWIR